MNNLLRCHQVCKTYQEGDLQTQVLKGVIFELQKGELASIIGSSGSGKSTLIRTFNGLETFDAGEIDILGIKINSPSAGPQVAGLYI